jgi:cell shape-determining protein MreC
LFVLEVGGQACDVLLEFVDGSLDLSLDCCIFGVLQSLLLSLESSVSCCQLIFHFLHCLISILSSFIFVFSSFSFFICLGSFLNDIRKLCELILELVVFGLAFSNLIEELTTKLNKATQNALAEKLRALQKELEQKQKDLTASKKQEELQKKLQKRVEELEKKLKDAEVSEAAQSALKKRVAELEKQLKDKESQDSLGELNDEYELLKESLTSLTGSEKQTAEDTMRALNDKIAEGKAKYNKF